MMHLTQRSGRHVPPEHMSMLWYGYTGLICWAIAAVVWTLAGSAVGVLPEFTGYVVAGAAFLAGVALLVLDSFVMRRRDRDRYRKAGFVVEPPNHGQRIHDLMVFRIIGSGPTKVGLPVTGCRKCRRPAPTTEEIKTVIACLQRCRRRHAHRSS